MNDMAAVIVPKSDQINADDLIAGPRTITIEAVSVRAGTEQPVEMRIAGDRKFFRPCKSMCRVMVAAWGPDSTQYVGRSLTLYRDPKVKWGGVEIGGIRISHMTGLERELIMALTEKKGSRQPFRVKPLAAPTAQRTPSPQPLPAGSAGLDDASGGNAPATTDDKAARAAAKAANAIIAAVEATETRAELMDVLSAHGDKNTRLQDAWPDEFARVKAAVDARNAEFTAADEVTA